MRAAQDRREVMGGKVSLARHGDRELFGESEERGKEGILRIEKQNFGM
jgi:hypothetical protein